MAYRRSTPEGKMIGGAFGVLIGAGLLLWSFWLLWQGLASRGWPTTTGTIVESRMESYRSKGRTRQRPLVAYEYRVDGRSYRSSTWDTAYGHPPSTALAEFPVGREVTVHVDPADPASAVLHTGLQSMHLLLVVMGVVLIAASAWSYQDGASALGLAGGQNTGRLYRSRGDFQPDSFLK